MTYEVALPRRYTLAFNVLLGVTATSKYGTKTEFQILQLEEAFLLLIQWTVLIFLLNVYAVTHFEVHSGIDSGVEMPWILQVSCIPGPGHYILVQS